MTDNDPKKSNRIIILCIFAAALAPLLIAWFLISPMGQGILSTHEPNGQLINPPLSLSGEPRKLLAPESGDDEPEKVRWSLLVFAGTSCEADCVEMLEYAHRSQMAMGKSMLRINRVVVTQSEDWLENPPEQALVAPAARTLQMTLDEQQNFHGGDDPARTYLALADPLGRVIIRYPERPDFLGFVKDMKRLMGTARH